MRRTPVTTAERLFPAAVLVFVAAVLGLGFVVYDYSATVMRFPVVVGGVTGVLCVLRIAAAVRRRAAPPADARAPAPPALGRAVLWLVGILPAVYLLGYLAGLPVYLFLYARAHGEGWAMAGGLALACLAVVYGVFMNLLAVPLPVQPLGWP